MRNSLTLLVSEYCAANVGNVIKGNALHAYITKSFPDLAPDTPARILRGLRARGIVSYAVSDRQKSEYKITEVH